MRLLRQYDDRINLSNIGQVPIHVRQRARVIEAAREEARLEMGKGALATLPVKA